MSFFYAHYIPIPNCNSDLNSTDLSEYANIQCEHAL